MHKPFTLLAAALLALPMAAPATPWREEPAMTALFHKAGVDGSFVLGDERRGELRGHNRRRAEQRFARSSTFKIANDLIGLSLGAVRSVDDRIPYTGDAAVEQTRFLSALAHQRLPFPSKAQQQVAEVTTVDSGPGWSLPAKTGWQNAPGAGMGWWVGWVQQGDQITPFALNLAMAGVQALL
jgi:beta-lactamase class D